MGIYAEYLDKQLDFQKLTEERKKQLARISKLRDRDVLVIAADMNKGGAPISISYPDILPLQAISEGSQKNRYPGEGYHSHRPC